MPHVNVKRDKSRPHRFHFVLDGALLATLTPADDDPGAEGLIRWTLTMAAGGMTQTLRGTLDEPPLNLARELAISFAGLDNA